MKRTISVICMICAFVSLAFAQQTAFEGTWHGELSLGNNRLPLVINLQDSLGTVMATIDSPAQGAYGIPADATIDADRLSVNIPRIGASYDGMLRGGKIVGTFSQGGMSLPLTLEYGPYIVQRPQTPRPPFPYTVSEVSFVNAGDGARLSGTLTMPVASHFRGKRVPVPVVLMVTGSGQQNRDEELFGHRPFAVIAHYLALNGISSLRFDDRGVGDSTGDLLHATTRTFACDAEAGLEYLRGKEGWFSNIGILGHSEGGSIAYMLAAEQKPDFIVSIAGPSMSGKEILLQQNRALLSTAGYSKERLEDYLTGLNMVFDYIIKHPGVSEWSTLETECADQTALLPSDLDNYKAILASSNDWLEEFLKYDPRKDIEKISCPYLVVYAEKDMQVPAQPNAEVFKEISLSDVKNARNPSETHSRVMTYPGLNHLMQHARTGLPNEYQQIDETFSEEVLDDIVKWIKSLPQR